MCGATCFCRWWPMPARWTGCRWTRSREMPFASSRRTPQAARFTRQAPQVQANRLNALRNVSRRFGNCWSCSRATKRLSAEGGRSLCKPVGQPALARVAADVLAVSGRFARQPELRSDASDMYVQQRGADLLQTMRPTGSSRFGRGGGKRECGSWSLLMAQRDATPLSTALGERVMMQARQSLLRATLRHQWLPTLISARLLWKEYSQGSGPR